ncbi:MAG TPA: hypothetical protein VKS01_09905, partial [Bryobacteraceae bacterium]|nr:hypothetical protein [Bryobacteraceae bacterium]
TGTANIWKWKGIVEGPDFVTIMLVDLNETFDATAGRIEYPAPPSPAMEAARATKAFQVFESFDQVPFWKSTPVDGGTEIELIDLRFGSPQHPGFEASALVDESGAVHGASVRFGR